MKNNLLIATDEELKGTKADIIDYVKKEMITQLQNETDTENLADNLRLAGEILELIEENNDNDNLPTRKKKTYVHAEYYDVYEPDFDKPKLINEKMGLINIDNDRTKINDCSYVLGGYCPLSLKIEEKAVEGQWNTINDVLRKLPGATIFPEDESEINFE